MPSEHLAELCSLRNLRDIAGYLSVTPRQLGYLMRGKPADRRYRLFDIPKRRGGVRRIVAPFGDLMAVQHALAERLGLIYSPRRPVHGFAKGRSIVSNASRHVKKRYVFNVDLEDFFPTINFGRVRGLFMKIGVAPAAATVLAQICCHDGKLPQGAPTSPIVSNMICWSLDKKLSALANEFRCVYSRYADDITFSRRTNPFPPEIGFLDSDKNARAGDRLRVIIEQSGFKINSNKVWLYNNKHRQVVTGLVVNVKTNVPRKYIREVRAVIHAWQKFGLENAERVYLQNRDRPAPNTPGTLLESIVRGKLEFIKMVKGVGDPSLKSLQSNFVRVCPEYLNEMIEENSLLRRRDVFISYASEDGPAVAKPLAEALVALGVSVWFDEYEIQVGDSLRGKVDEGLASASHGVLVLSPHFFSLKKSWTRRELDGLTAIEDVNERPAILPVLHAMTSKTLATFSPTLAGIKALRTRTTTIADIALKIRDRIRTG